MRLTIPDARTRLAASARSIRALVESASDEQARWKPSASRWSILEVVNHLADEEVEDFRTRVDLLLHRPGAVWPGIDPEGWVAARGYAARDPDESLGRFLRERQRSLAWLDEIRDPNWDHVYPHPSFGAISAGSLLASWVAHDLLHVRQLARLHHEFIAMLARPHSLAYAGTW